MLRDGNDVYRAVWYATLIALFALLLLTLLVWLNPSAGLSPFSVFSLLIPVSCIPVGICCAMQEINHQASFQVSAARKKISAEDITETEEKTETQSLLEDRQDHKKLFFLPSFGRVTPVPVPPVESISTHKAHFAS